MTTTTLSKARGFNLLTIAVSPVDKITLVATGKGATIFEKPTTSGSKGSAFSAMKPVPLEDEPPLVGTIGGHGVKDVAYGTSGHA